MLADVLDTCQQARGLVSGTLAVVDEPAARAVALRGGALAIADPGVGDMNAAVAAGVAAVTKLGAETGLIVPGDVPLISGAGHRAPPGSAGAEDRAGVSRRQH